MPNDSTRGETAHTNGTPKQKATQNEDCQTITKVETTRERDWQHNGRKSVYQTQSVANNSTQSPTHEARQKSNEWQSPPWSSPSWVVLGTPPQEPPTHQQRTPHKSRHSNSISENPKAENIIRRSFPTRRPGYSKPSPRRSGSKCQSPRQSK